MTEQREEEVRTAVLLGESAMDRLHGAHVAIFGIGGVGGYTCEALARAGVGSLTLIDSDTVSRSNINRQLIALQSTVGRAKVEVMKDRIADINPACCVRAIQCFYLPENTDQIPLGEFDYIVDAIDTVSAKLELVVRAGEQQVPIISAMGAGNKSNASGFCVTDLFSTSGCPLARVMRRELRARGIHRLKVVYSEEPAMAPASDAPPMDAEGGNRRSPGSLPYMPGIAGLMLAGEVIRELTQGK